MSGRTLRSAAHRLRHRSRSVAVSVALAVVALAAIWLGVESVLAALGLRPLLIAPAQLASLAAAGGPAVIAAAAAVAVAGLVAVILAVAPGRLARRELTDERAVYLIDDDVLASGISRVSARAARVGADQVRTSISRRRAVTTLRPSTGFPADRGATADAVAAVISSLEPKPAPRTSVAVESQGVLA